MAVSVRHFGAYGVKIRMKRSLRSLLGVAALGALATASLGFAQTVRDDGSLPNVGLNLPTTLTTFGKVEPTLRKPTAIVNGDVITGTDVEQRLSLVLLANGGQIAAEERDRLRVQVLRNLIDESLQIQEAKGNDVAVAKAEVDQSFARVAQNFKRTPEQLRQYLKQSGSSERSMKRQIEGELAWSRLLRRKVEPFVNVSDDEVNAVIARLNEAKGTTEYRYSEIFLSSAPENLAEVTANARKIIDQLRQGGSFAAYARQFSEASTASVGGDGGWVRPAQLPAELGQALQELAVGQVAGPIAIPGGVSVLFLADTKQVLVANPRDAVLNLRQLGITFPAGISAKDAQAKATAFAQATQSMAGCGGAEAVSKQFGAEMVDNDQIRVGDLPGPLQEMLLKLQIGQASPPFGSQAEGVRVLVMCGRDDPQDAGAPSAERVEEEIRDKRVNRRAQIYLRDLRRDAVVDYR
jgi:peptidyl-prolyl cis-trans isomerase SurA